ncbi:MAG: hypothetical protein GWN67_14895, partial [Phycisphaerae bacterium]|nr:hypothetical protein [Phycisphaerae bacterium]NIP52850.1 hypothetical protein [Phycisphaerae bacterium]NIS51871.1 hypothetical protein [Phycisphaerae bacterium]NIU09389.1 hypothetical protein [Phycisphaerae bacterium]NIU57623.1 hypothetical protein [Phycisphaerae bacterium]
MVKKKPQTEKKKPGVYKRIVKWTGLGLLVLLLIAALIFQAPWKVIALLLIVLAACTVLPKPYRKWFWLSVATVVLVLIIWVFLPEDSEGWRPYTFDEELAALEAKYAIPDSENAATIYNALLEDYGPNTIHPDFLDPNIDHLTLREAWSSEDYPELATWLQEHQKTITKLLEASKVEKCVFPITHDTLSLSDIMDYLPNIRGWAFLLVRAGNNDMAEGRIEEGLEKYLCVKKIGDHLWQQSTMLEILVGKAVEDLALGRFKAFVVTTDATEEHLNLIEKAVVDIKYDWSSDITRILECEKLMTKNLICSMAYQVNSEGRTRFSRDPIAAMRSEFPEELPLLTYWQKKLAKAGTILGWFVVPSTPQKAGEIIDGSYEQFYAMIEPDFDWQREPPELFSLLTPWNFTRIRFNFGFLVKLLVSMSEESYYSIHDLYLRNITEQRGNHLIIALRRYRNENDRWPEKLEEVKSLAPAEIFVDPINGNSFVYKLTQENFTLYSKGKNNIDEDGIREITFDPNDFKWFKTEGDDILIWQPKTRKTKNEKADA